MLCRLVQLLEVNFILFDPGLVVALIATPDVLSFFIAASHVSENARRNFDQHLNL